jgi:hypothetical protein
MKSKKGRKYKIKRETKEGKKSERDKKNLTEKEQNDRMKLINEDRGIKTQRDSDRRFRRSRATKMSPRAPGECEKKQISEIAIENRK